MNKKLTLSVVTFSGIVAVLSGGIESGIVYAVNIILISLCYMYTSIKKKNDELSIVMQKWSYLVNDKYNWLYFIYF